MRLAVVLLLVLFVIFLLFVMLENIYFGEIPLFNVYVIYFALQSATFQPEFVCEGRLT